MAILKDGSEGQTFPLSREATEIGRKEGNILLPEDRVIQRVIDSEPRVNPKDPDIPYSFFNN